MNEDTGSTAPSDSPADRIAEIRARAEAATPGPWWGLLDKSENYWNVYAKIPGTDVPAVLAQELTEEDAELVVRGRTDVPWLLDEVERLTEAPKNADEAAWHQGLSGPWYLCWEGNEEGLACDRMAGHPGKHSWELS